MGMAAGGLARGGEADDSDSRIAERILSAIREGDGKGENKPKSRVSGDASYSKGQGARYNVRIPMGDLLFALGASGRKLKPDQFDAGVSGRIGNADLYMHHALRGGTDYGGHMPVGPGNLSVGAGASRGFIPDSVRASYNMPFAEGGEAFAPPYMSGGGLSELPVPDTMFDEPTNGGFDDGYAGGGIVAFRGGGPTEERRAPVGTVDPRIVQGLVARGIPEHVALGAAGGIFSESSNDPYAVNPTSGAMGWGQWLGPRQKDLLARYGPKPGPEKQLDFLAYELKGGDMGGAAVMSSKSAPEAAANYIAKFMRPGEKDTPGGIRRALRAIGARADTGGAGAIPERDTRTTQGVVSGLGDVYGAINARLGRTTEEEETDKLMRERIKELASPEYYEKERKDSMWATLAQIGFNMASSKSPYLLQAVGEAASAALPGALADKKERKALKDRALDAMQGMNGLRRKENQELFKMAVDVQQVDLAQKQFGEQMELKRDELGLSEEQLNLARSKLDAEIEAMKSKGADVESTLLAMFIEGGAPMELAKEYLGLRYPKSISTTGPSPDDIRELGKGRGGSGGGNDGVIDFSLLPPPQ
jgi:hypothetical protein